MVYGAIWSVRNRCRIRHARRLEMPRGRHVPCRAAFGITSFRRGVKSHPGFCSTQQPWRPDFARRRHLGVKTGEFSGPGSDQTSGYVAGRALSVPWSDPRPESSFRGTLLERSTHPETYFIRTPLVVIASFWSGPPRVLCPLFITYMPRPRHRPFDSNYPNHSNNSILASLERKKIEPLSQTSQDAPLHRNQGQA